jgi:hypothetical protein
MCEYFIKYVPGIVFDKTSLTDLFNILCHFQKIRSVFEKEAKYKSCGQLFKFFPTYVD